ncbi:MAG: LynF/TruF/PatF family peptide O-prenyltransferase [Coleofasciculus sp. G1-WW12-02]|uniref:LynF/TruF/PatF family peptide O-prenyltransferase n=1 Tax=Coleofasciculus sp. G1-WW12-02 TaxID=3068483 RepID=UPI0032F99E31
MMILTTTWQDNKKKDRRIQHLRHHFESFDVEPAFPLPLFEQAVFDLDSCPFLEPSCKVEGNTLFAGRINAYTKKHWRQLISSALEFLDGVESRVEVTIDRNLLEKFLTLHLNSGKIEASLMGIDLRPNVKDSSLKVHLRLDPHQDVDELVMTAISLDGGYYSPELTQVLLKDTFLIGFDFFLDGRSAVEMYTCCSGRNLLPVLGKRGVHLKHYACQKLSNKAVSLLEEVTIFMMGFSQANINPVLYFEFENTKHIQSHFLFNTLGDKIINFCLNDKIEDSISIGVTEQDLEKSRLENFRFYYRKAV